MAEASALTSSHRLTNSCTRATAQASPAACSRVPTVRNPIFSGSESSYTSDKIRCSDICGLPSASNNSIFGVGKPMSARENGQFIREISSDRKKLQRKRGTRIGKDTYHNVLLSSTMERGSELGSVQAKVSHLLLNSSVNFRVLRIVVVHWHHSLVPDGRKTCLG